MWIVGSARVTASTQLSSVLSIYLCGTTITTNLYHISSVSQSGGGDPAGSCDSSDASSCVLSINFVRIFSMTIGENDLKVGAIIAISRCHWADTRGAAMVVVVVVWFVDEFSVIFVVVVLWVLVVVVVVVVLVDGDTINISSWLLNSMLTRWGYDRFVVGGSGDKPFLHHLKYWIEKFGWLIAKWRRGNDVRLVITRWCWLTLCQIPWTCRWCNRQSNIFELWIG